MLGVCQIVRAGTPDALSGIRLFVRHGHQGAEWGRRYLTPFGEIREKPVKMGRMGTEVPVPFWGNV